MSNCSGKSIEIELWVKGIESVSISVVKGLFLSCWLLGFEALTFRRHELTSCFAEGCDQK